MLGSKDIIAAHQTAPTSIQTIFLAFLPKPIYNSRMDRELLFLTIKEILVDQFDVEESNVSLDANLYEELQIDSIDAVDLLVQMKKITGNP